MICMNDPEWLDACDEAERNGWDYEKRIVKDDNGQPMHGWENDATGERLRDLNDVLLVCRSKEAAV